MFNEFTIALHLDGVMEFGDITKYTGYHVEYLHRCKSMVVNYNAIVKAVLDLGYSVKKLWYATPGDSLKSGLVQIVGDDQVLELVGLGSSFGVIEVYIEGATLGNDSGSSTSGHNSESDSYRESEPEQDPGTLSLSDDDYILGGGNEDFFIARQIRREADATAAITNTVVVNIPENDGDTDLEEGDENLSPPNSDGDEEVCDQRRSKTIRYDPKSDHKDIQFKVGMRFASRAQFKKAVQLYAIINRFNIGWKKSEAKKMDGRCESGCEWRVYASWMQSEKTFIIKTIGKEHTCLRSMRNKNASYIWLADQFLPKIRANLKYTTSQMQADAMEMWALTLNRRICYRAITRAVEIIRGPFVEQYKLLHSYKAELIRCSPNSTFNLEVGQYNKFKRFYVCFKELKEGFLAGCRRVIGLDGCFTKTLVRGMLLCAIGRDGNNQMFPIAWAVVEAETEESWTWFLELLVKDLNVGQGLGWTFMSDQQKGLLNAVSKLSPRAEHRNCARHIYANWKKLYKGETFRDCFWRAAYSTYEADFNMAVKEMKKESVHAYEDFMRQGPEHFCRAFIKCGQNCNAIENNLSEMFNAYICKEREFPIVDMLEGIRKLLMVRMYEKSQLMVGSRDEICPRIRLKIEEEKMKSRFCIPKPSTASRFEVEVNDDTFMIDLNKKTCTCRQWDISGIPCNHAISCINFMKCNLNDYVADCFKKAMYERCYQFALPTLNGKKMWPATSEEPLLPPPFRKLPGRPKKDRKRPNGEKKKDEKRKRVRKPRVTNTDPTKISKSGITMKCSNCHGTGHNKTTCPQPPASIHIKLSGKRGRPRKHPKQLTIGGGASNKQSESTSARSITGQSNIVNSEKRMVLQGYGFYVSEATGNSYLRMPGSNIVQEIRQGGANHMVDLSSQVSGPPQTEQSQSEVGQ